MSHIHPDNYSVFTKSSWASSQGVLSCVHHLPLPSYTVKQQGVVHHCRRQQLQKHKLALSSTAAFLCNSSGSKFK